MDILLNSIRSYIPLSKEDEKIVKQLFREKKLDKGDYLLEAGNVCRYLAFIDPWLNCYNYDRG